ncbi:MAG TPA: vitamin B12-binding protein [Lactobacillus sp.]|nr:vitamin B12-binding protein [Lactobacillus sp.]
MTSCCYDGNKQKESEARFYGQIPRISVLPVTWGWHLRANPRKRHFARNRGLPFTGKSQESAFCP